MRCTTFFRHMAFFLLALAAASAESNAIAVASDYLVNNTLELIRGTSTLYSIRLQNPTDYVVGIAVDYDDSFMKVIDYKDVYILQPKETGYKILFNVTAPNKPGLYSIGYTVGEVEPGGGGGVGLRLKINKNFNLRVIKDPNRFYLKPDYIAYGAIAAAFLFYRWVPSTCSWDILFAFFSP